jgi:hypothetical protein
MRLCGYSAVLYMGGVNWEGASLPRVRAQYALGGPYAVTLVSGANASKPPNGASLAEAFTGEPNGSTAVSTAVSPPGSLRFFFEINSGHGTAPDFPVACKSCGAAASNGIAPLRARACPVMVPTVAGVDDDAVCKGTPK